MIAGIYLDGAMIGGKRILLPAIGGQRARQRKTRLESQRTEKNGFFKSGDRLAMARQRAEDRATIILRIERILRPGRIQGGKRIRMVAALVEQRGDLYLRLPVDGRTTRRGDRRPALPAAGPAPR